MSGVPASLYNRCEMNLRRRVEGSFQTQWHTLKGEKISHRIKAFFFSMSLGWRLFPQAVVGKVEENFPSVFLKDAQVLLQSVGFHALK